MVILQMETIGGKQNFFSGFQKIKRGLEIEIWKLKLAKEAVIVDIDMDEQLSEIVIETWANFK